MVQKPFHENGAQRYRQGTAKVPPSGTAKVTALGISDDDAPLPDEHRYPANVHRQPACASTLSRTPGCPREARRFLSPPAPAPLPRPAPPPRSPAPPRRAVSARQAATSAPRSASARQAPSDGDGHAARHPLVLDPYAVLLVYLAAARGARPGSFGHGIEHGDRAVQVPGARAVVAEHKVAWSGVEVGSGVRLGVRGGDWVGVRVRVRVIRVGVRVRVRFRVGVRVRWARGSPAPPHTAHASSSQSGHSHVFSPEGCGGGSRQARWKGFAHSGEAQTSMPSPAMG